MIMYFPVIRNNRNNWLDSAFDDLFDMNWTPRRVNTAPAVNVKESDTAFTMDIAAPGLKKEFCKVNINNEGNLVVKIENKTEQEDCSNADGEKTHHYLRREFSYASYEQAYTLPENVDKDRISAKVEDGILTIELPKLTPEQEKKVDRVIEIG